MVGIMTNEQRYIQMSCYFERLVNEVELEEQILKNRCMRRSISNIEYLQKMTELKKTL